MRSNYVLKQSVNCCKQPFAAFAKTDLIQMSDFVDRSFIPNLPW